MGCSVFRIFVTTDNHLGYKERDPIRHHDSFRTFNEALTLARFFRSDLVLHSGDLFDVQKPSQNAIIQAIDSIRTNLVDGEGVEDEEGLLIHAAGDKDSKLNFEESYLNVKIPMFVINGNHDEALRQEGKPVSPLDLLASSCLVNKIGTVDDLDNILIKPVILVKEKSKLAVYGLDYVRDERIHRIFKLGKIKFVEPEDPESTFCVLLFHQNRFKGNLQGAPNKCCIHEDMLPSFMDLVIWGHEHDTNIMPHQSLKGDYHIMQPGSSVATSLSKGEATFKRNAVLEVEGKRFRVHALPLLTVRPFVFRAITEAELARNCNVDEISSLWQYLETTMETECLPEASQWRKELLSDWEESMQRCLSQLASSSRPVRKEGLQALKEQILACIESEDAVLPLIRLRVDLGTAQTDKEFSISRFGALFAKRIANAEDVLFFSRRFARSEVSKPPSNLAPLLEIRSSGASHEAYDLIFYKLSEHDNLNILDASKMSEAIRQYIDRSDTGSLEHYVSSAFKDLGKALMKSVPDSAEDLDAAIEDQFGRLRQSQTLSGSYGTESLSPPSNNENQHDQSDWDPMPQDFVPSTSDLPPNPVAPQWQSTAASSESKTLQQKPSAESSTFGSWTRAPNVTPARESVDSRPLAPASSQRGSQISEYSGLQDVNAKSGSHGRRKGVFSPLDSDEDEEDEIVMDDSPQGVPRTAMLTKSVNELLAGEAKALSSPKRSSPSSKTRSTSRQTTIVPKVRTKAQTRGAAKNSTSKPVSRLAALLD